LSLSDQPTMTNSWRRMHLTLSQQRVLVPRYGALAFFEMMPSPPSAQMALNSASPLATTWSP
jgi:hypothetical protein